jgi:hypothetical protein
MSLESTPPAAAASSRAPPPSHVSVGAPATLVDVVSLFASTSFLKRRHTGTHVLPQTCDAATSVVPAVAKAATAAKPAAPKTFHAEEEKGEDHDEPWQPAPAPIPVTVVAGCQRERRLGRARRRVKKVKNSTPNRFKLRAEIEADYWYERQRLVHGDVRRG